MTIGDTYLAVVDYGDQVAVLDRTVDAVLNAEPDIRRFESALPDDYGSATTARYRQYNILRYEGMEHARGWISHAVFAASAWMPSVARSRPAWIHAWVNVFREGQHLGWHEHQQCVMHGSLVLAAKRSCVVYRNPDTTFVVVSRPGLLTVIGGADLPHMTTPVDERCRRVSIGFNVYDESARGHSFLEPLAGFG